MCLAALKLLLLVSLYRKFRGGIFNASIFFVMLLGLTNVVRAVDIDLPPGDPDAPISVSSDKAWSWREGMYEVWLLSGNAQVRQGSLSSQGSDAVLWIHRAARSDEPSRVIAFFEGNVRIEEHRGGTAHTRSGETMQSYRDKQWFGRFETRSRIELDVPFAGEEPSTKPPVYRRALAARSGETSEVQQAQFTQPLPPSEAAPPAAFAPPGVMPPQELAPPVVEGPRDPFAGLSNSGVKRVQIWPRSSVRWQARSAVNPNNPTEQITTITSGVQIVIDSDTQFGTVTVETDRIVIWSPPVNLTGVTDRNPLQAAGPIELYMEGNIVFRQGDRLIYADRMYYNATQEYGVVLSAEMLTPVKDYQGLARIKADVLQQIDKQTFQAYGAALTTSRLGVPRYWMQSERITFEDRQELGSDPVTGQAPIDPVTGEPQLDHELLATSRNNFLYFGGAPLFYWPFIATDLKKPTFYVSSIAAKSDTIFGQQLLIDYDMYQLLGWQRKPAGTDWTLSSDYLSDRGWGLGTRFEYNRGSFLGIDGPAYGFADVWGLYDSGKDVLGLDRLSLEPEEQTRGRALVRHRQELPNSFTLSAELGLISDRNFLEQYFEREWDQLKDESTGVELKQLRENGSWSVTADVRPDGFFTQTEWLPRADHFLLGQEVFGDRATWMAHSHVGYGHLRTASPPQNPVDAAKFDPLAWEFDREGVRTATRHELDLPVELGPVKVVPYVLGELAYWGEDINGESIGRAFGQTGIRASMPMWRVDPDVRSLLFNVKGIAHKVVFETEFLYADASQNLERFPLYDPLDDDAQEHFRRRFFFNTFNGVPGGNVPLKFDERVYAFRSGIQSWVTSPTVETVDDLMMARVGMRNRWQTKRGPVGKEHIVDWITLDLDASLYPDADRDNFGEALGMANYDFKWHIGDRLSLLSDGFADVFGQGLRQVTVGANLGRPDSGNVYVGFRSTEGPISSNVVMAFANYRMTEKWIANVGASFDFGGTGNIGQSFGVTRVGEAFLLTLGGNYDASRESLGVFFGIEPRFLPRGRQGIVNGVRVPPAGTFGLE